jgi:hypothetical protein
MKPPTEEQLNEEVDDGYGLQYEGEPSWSYRRDRPPQNGARRLRGDVRDGHRQVEEGGPSWSHMVRHYNLSIELETEWHGRGGPSRRGHYQQKLKEAEENSKRN